MSGTAWLADCWASLVPHLQPLVDLQPALQLLLPPQSSVLHLPLLRRKSACPSQGTLLTLVLLQQQSLRPRAIYQQRWPLAAHALHAWVQHWRHSRQTPWHRPRRWASCALPLIRRIGHDGTPKGALLLQRPDALLPWPPLQLLKLRLRGRRGKLR